MVTVKHGFFETTVILGIPIDNLGIDEAVDKIFFMADAYETDGRPRIAVLVNTNTIIALRAHGRKLSVKDGEVINIFRQADLMIPVGRLMALAARIVGTRLKPTFPGTRWFSKFLSLAEKKGKSLFLIGNGSKGMHTAADLIRRSFPGIRVSGSALFEDKAGGPDKLLDKINKAAADFLIIDLQDPRGVLWLARNRNRLYLAVVLAVSGTRQIAAATGQNKKNGLKKPLILLSGTWRHLVKTPLVFGFTILPLVVYQQYRHLAHKMFHVRQPVASVKSSLSRSEQGTILKIIELPDPLDASVVGEIKDELKQMIQNASKIVLDLSNVYFMDSSGLGLLLTLWRRAGAGNRKIFLVGIQPPIYRFFKLSRTLDFFENSMLPNLDEVIALLSRKSDFSSFHYLAVIRDNAVVFHLYGELDAPRIRDTDLNAVIETLGQRNAIFNLSGLNFIDSAGMHLFIQIQRHAARHGRSCIFCGLQPTVRQMLEILRLDRLFAVAENVYEAQDLLARINGEKARKPGRENRYFPPAGQT